jgi:hypothetical protein
LLARLDKPLRPVGAAKTAEAPDVGGISLQSLLKMSHVTTHLARDGATMAVETIAVETMAVETMLAKTSDAA